MDSLVADSSVSLPSWRVPGPSTRYHRPQHRRSQHHARFSNPETEIPRASYAAAPHLARAKSPFSPAALVRSHTAPMASDNPLTPLRDTMHTAALAQDSPFSDYFTDEARSASHKSSYDLPSAEAQRVLLRLNNLGAHVLRQQGPVTSFESISDKLDELERSLSGLETSSRGRGALSDSGFVDDDACSPIGTSPSLRYHGFTPLAMDVRSKVPLEEEPEDQDVQAERERILAEAQSVLARVSKANVELRMRFDEMRELNERHAYQVEESAGEALALRMENEKLKSAITLDHSELLFLKLSLKALEVQIAPGQGGAETAQEAEKRVNLEYGIDQWKSDWDDVDARQRERRAESRIVSSTPNGIVHKREDGRSPDEQGDWRLDLCKKREGRVHSITISRTNTGLGLDGMLDEAETNEEVSSRRTSKDAAMQTDLDDWIANASRVGSESVTRDDLLDMELEHVQNAEWARSMSPIKIIHEQEPVVIEHNHALTMSSVTVFHEQEPVVIEHDHAHTTPPVTVLQEQAPVHAVQHLQAERSSITTVHQQAPVSATPEEKSFSLISVIFSRDNPAPDHVPTSMPDADGALATVESGKMSRGAVRNSPDVHERDLSKRSAWQEFMDGLTELAGMADR